jgi:hypothetical protein
MTEVARIFRFFACLMIALTPMIVVALIGYLGGRPTRTDAGWSIIDSILLLGFIAYLVIVKGWSASRR